MQALANVLANAIERRDAEERTRHEALHDPLTGLPNRNLFLDRLEHALAQRPRATSPRSRSSSWTSTSSRWSTTASATPPATSCWRRSRRGSSRRCAPATPSPASAATSSRSSPRTSPPSATRSAIAERIAEALTRPFVLRQREHFASASIGISIAHRQRGARGADPRRRRRPVPRQGARARRLRDLRRGDALARDRPHADRERPAPRAPARRARAPLPADRRPARRRDRRCWRRCCAGAIPSAGCSGPPAFIPVAEESRLIVPIGRWVLEEACRDAAGWQQRRPRLPAGRRRGQHLGPQQLGRPGARCSTVNASARDSGIDPGDAAPGADRVAPCSRRPTSPESSLAVAEGARREAGARRLRHRLLLARLPEAAAALGDQARPRLHREPGPRVQTTRRSCGRSPRWPTPWGSTSSRRGWKPSISFAK